MRIKKQILEKNWRLVMAATLIIQLLAFCVLSLIAHADINHPEQVSVEYEKGVNYRMEKVIDL